jgi:hypothetical protein
MAFLSPPDPEEPIMPHYLKSRDIKKTRVKHRCCNCNRTINIGESCIESSNIYDGHVYSIYNCDVCQAFEKYMSESFGQYDRDVMGFLSEEMIYSNMEGYDEFAATYVIESVLSE